MHCAARRTRNSLFSKKYFVNSTLYLETFFCKNFTFTKFLSNYERSSFKIVMPIDRQFCVLTKFWSTNSIMNTLRCLIVVVYLIRAWWLTIFFDLLHKNARFWSFLAYFCFKINTRGATTIRHLRVWTFLVQIKSTVHKLNHE